MPRKKRLEAVYNLRQIIHVLRIEHVVTGDDKVSDEMVYNMALLRQLERE
jgi:hypothetical protein